MATQATATAPPIALRDRYRRPVSIGVAFVVFAWSLVELYNLFNVHTTGPEIYGVAIAFLSVVAGALTLALLVSSKRRVWASVAVIALWAIVALGGLAGTYYHAVGVDPKYGPVDPRPRPQGAPLIFVALGLTGFGALFYGQHLSAARQSEE